MCSSRCFSRSRGFSSEWNSSWKRFWREEFLLEAEAEEEEMKLILLRGGEVVSGAELELTENGNTVVGRGVKELGPLSEDVYVSSKHPSSKPPPTPSPQCCGRAKPLENHQKRPNHPNGPEGERVYTEAQ